MREFAVRPHISKALELQEGSETTYGVCLCGLLFGSGIWVELVSGTPGVACLVDDLVLGLVGGDA